MVLSNVAHIGVDAGSGYVHSLTGTAANVHDLDEAVRLVRVDGEVVYADSGYQGAHKRGEFTGDEHRSSIRWRVAARKATLKAMPEADRAIESRKASVRAEVEHPFQVMKRDFGFARTRYRGIAKNLHHLHMLFASANWLMRSRAVALSGWRRSASLPGTAPTAPGQGPGARGVTPHARPRPTSGPPPPHMAEGSAPPKGPWRY